VPLVARLMVTLTILLVPCATCAHGGDSVRANWEAELLSALFLTLCAILYGIGAVKLHRRAVLHRLVGLPQTMLMSAGLGILAITLLSPLHALAEQLVSAHMVQHLLLMLIASPLIVWGRPMIVFIWALPRRSRKMFASVWRKFHGDTLARIIQHPATAWIAFCGSIAFWHLPRLYRIAVNDEGLHVLMHLSFLAAGLLFWSVVLEPSGKRRLDFGRSILFVFSAAMVTGIPGALLSFGRRVIYQDPNAAMPFGLSPLEDQQLAGLIMWIPMDLVLFGVAGALFVAWLSSADRRQLANGPAHAGPLLLLPILFLLSGCGESANVEANPDLDGNRGQGAALIIQYGCGTCHEITGIPGAHGLVGPSLDHFGRRIYIAGMLRNSPDNLLRWLQDPQAIVSGNVMPNMHISKVDANDIAAYLLTIQ
jgi:putative membrane protein